MVFEPRCKVCNSPNRKEYEMMKRSKKTINEIMDMVGQHGEDISIAGMNRHLYNHLLKKPYQSDFQIQDREGTKETTPSLPQASVKEVLSRDAKALERIEKGIQSAETLVDTLFKKVDLSDPKQIHAIKELLDVIRENLSFTYKLSQTINIEPEVSERDVIKRILELLEDSPRELTAWLTKKLKGEKTEVEKAEEEAVTEVEPTNSGEDRPSP